MENRSPNNPNRRPSGNRTGGRSRSRQGNQSNNEGGSSSGGRPRSRNRNRNGSTPKAPVQTTGQKILSVITFGLLGKPKPKARSGHAARNARKPAPAAAPKTRTPRNVESPDTAEQPKRNRNEVTSGRLYVGNLDYSTGEVELESLFSGAGNVVSAEVVTNPRTQQSKGFAFVEMRSIAEAKRAVSELDDKDFNGRKLIVSGARSDGPHDESTGESALAESAPDVKD